MSTSTLSPSRGETTLPDANRPIPFSRLAVVEARKLIDTRSGRTLVSIVVVLMVLAVGLPVLVNASNDLPLTYRSLLDISMIPTALLLPVLGVLSVTGEWSQRTHMVTFTLEPRRERIVGAKVVAVAAVAVLIALVGMAFTAIAYAVYGSLGVGSVDWTLTIAQGVGFIVTEVLGVLTGVGFGILLLNTPAAIVCFAAFAYVLPVIFAIVQVGVPALADVLPWIDFIGAQAPLTDGALTAEAWGHLLVSGAIWLFLPIAVGVLRVVRADIK